MQQKTYKAQPETPTQTQTGDKSVSIWI